MVLKRLILWITKEFENFILVISGTIVFISISGVILLPTFFSGHNVAVLSIILQFFSSTIFSWIIAVKTTAKSYKEKQKELAQRSYRHTYKVGENTVYILKRIEDLIEEMKVNYSTHDNYMDYISKLYSIKDMLFILKGDVEVSISDWEDSLDDISVLLEEKRRKVEEYAEKTAKLKLMHDNKTMEAKNLRLQIDKLRNEIAQLNMKIPIDKKENQEQIFRAIGTLLQSGYRKRSLTFTEIVKAFEEVELEPNDIDWVYDIITGSDIELINDLSKNGA